jgi:hypothetical protein
MNKILHKKEGLMFIRTLIISIIFSLAAGCATEPAEQQIRPSGGEPIQRLIRETIFLADDTADQIREYSYSADGTQVVQEKVIDAASGSVREIVYYDYRNGLRAERRSYNEDNKLTGRRTYTYTAGGLPETEKYFDEQNVLTMCSAYTYDAGGNKLEWTTTGADGTVMATTRYTYQNGRLAGTILSGPDTTADLTINISYDPAGKTILETYTTPAGNTEKEITYLYDEQGRVKIQETFSSFKNSMGKIVYTYSGQRKQADRIQYFDEKGKPQKTIANDWLIIQSSESSDLLK